MDHKATQKKRKKNSVFNSIVMQKKKEPNIQQTAKQNILKKTTCPSRWEIQNYANWIHNFVLHNVMLIIPTRRKVYTIPTYTNMYMYIKLDMAYFMKIENYPTF